MPRAGRHCFFYQVLSVHPLVGPHGKRHAGSDPYPSSRPVHPYPNVLKTFHAPVRILQAPASGNGGLCLVHEDLDRWPNPLRLSVCKISTGSQCSGPVSCGNRLNAAQPAFHSGILAWKRSQGRARPGRATEKSLETLLCLSWARGCCRHPEHLHGAWELASHSLLGLQTPCG
jgi:hypothetical protein